MPNFSFQIVYSWWFQQYHSTVLLFVMIFYFCKRKQKIMRGTYMYLGWEIGKIWQREEMKETSQTANDDS